VAVAHDSDRVTLDAVREWCPPFNPQAVVEECVAFLKRYRCNVVTGDRFSGQFAPEAFRRCGVDYVPTSRSRSQLCLDVLPMINSGLVDLLDHEKMLTQFSTLERVTVRGSRSDVVDHRRGTHDDISNVVAGALVHLAAANDWLSQQVVSCPPLFIKSDENRSVGSLIDAATGGLQW